MGGGNYGTKGRYSIRRQEKLIEPRINETGKDFEVDLSYNFHNIKVVNEKQWSKVYGNQEGNNAVAFYRGGKDNTIYIRRKEFAKLGKSTIIHETLHTQAGPNVYGTKLGKILEEGTVEYLTEYTIANKFRTKSIKFAKQDFVYTNEVRFVQKLMTIVGPKQYLKYWAKGFKETNYQFADDLKEKGYERTATELLSQYRFEFAQPKTKEEIYNILDSEIVKNKTFDSKRNFKIITYEKPD